jgi:hypothetical protein
MTALETMVAAYGAEHEPWLQALLTACEATGQAATARELGYSSTTVNLAINGKYDRDLTELERRVRRVLMGPLDCPVRGSISDEDCRSNQALPFSTSNSERVRLYRACRNGCPNSSIAARTP